MKDVKEMKAIDSYGMCPEWKQEGLYVDGGYVIPKEK